MDTESLLLALELQRQDLMLWEQSLKGKQRADQVTDSDVALELCHHELDRMAMLVSDGVLSLSIARAVDSDAHIIAEAKAAEEQATRDRDFAVRLSTNPNAKPASGKAVIKGQGLDHSTETIDDAWIESFRHLNILTPAVIGDVLDDENLGNAESSNWAASRKRPESRECIACNERYSPSALYHSPCSHEYCHECLVGLVSLSLKDESLFPPRCCGQQIPVKPGRWFSPDLFGRFQAKKIEFETPNRTYCSEPSCSTFVPAAFIRGEVAHCPKCNRKTCVHCKGQYHTGICPSDSASQLVLQLASENGWQRCYACQRVVELDVGCYHMTCLCRAQFCYVCGERWKTCRCPQWHEDRLLRRANDIVDRANDAGRLDARARQIRVEQQRVNLIENHECNHDRWVWRPGPRQCEECYQTMPQYIFECRRCRIVACRRCRLNRL